VDHKSELLLAVLQPEGESVSRREKQEHSEQIGRHNELPGTLQRQNNHEQIERDGRAPEEKISDGVGMGPADGGRHVAEIITVKATL